MRSQYEYISLCICIYGAAAMHEMMRANAQNLRANKRFYLRKTQPWNICPVPMMPNIGINL